MLSTFGIGFGVSSSLIIAIGAQNAFVLGQGIHRQYPLMVALICAMSDAALIVIGVAGLGELIASHGLWSNLMAYGGAAFLFWYGFTCFRNAFVQNTLESDRHKKRNRKQVLILTLAITFLNPHVYLDTVVLLGSISAQYDDTARPFFAAGAIMASFVWFFSMSLGARWASPYLSNPMSWKVIDILSGLVMWAVAISLII